MARQRKLIVEADGGARGNPGPAGYGAVVADAASGEVLAELAEGIGTATNNVAEYRGLIAGLSAAARIAPGAAVDVRMDSKLVVEQMSGRWQIKHPALRPLARAAQDAARRLGPVTYAWVPRERNRRADKLANDAMDAAERLSRGATRRQGAPPQKAKARPGGPPGPAAARAAVPTQGDTVSPGARPARGTPPDPHGPDPNGPEPPGSAKPPAARAGTAEADQVTRPGRAALGWGAYRGRPTTTVLLRHGQTPLSIDKRFAGSTDVDLTELGTRQAKAAAQRLADRAGPRIGMIVTSPLRRARRTAEEVARATGAPLRVEPGLRETDFGAWEGRTFAEVSQGWPAEIAAWLSDADAAPPGGESFAAVDRRVLAVLDRLLAEQAAAVVLLVSHVTPIKTLVRHALLAPAAALYRMHLDVACLSEVDWFDDGPAVVRYLNDTAHLTGIE